MWPWKKTKAIEDLCLRDLQDQIEVLKVNVVDSENTVSDLKRHQTCAAFHDGQHPLIFREVRNGGWFLNSTFVFVCEDCGLEVYKQKANLSEIERDALINLGQDNLKPEDEEKQ